MLNTGIRGKWILITGATSGIGEAITRQFADEGAYVIAVGRNTDKLDDLAEEYAEPEERGSVLSYTCDLLDMSSIQGLFQSLRERGILLDGLIHCAGLAPQEPVRNADPNEAETVFRINYLALLELGRFFAQKKYSKDGACLIAISSLSSMTNDRGMGVYGASKAAVNALIRTMSKEYMRRGLRANAILPGHVRTPMFLAGAETSDSYMEEVLGRQPLGLIEPEEIAGIAEFLMSDHARHMTGELITVSGGMTH